jgi:hypothetical protein
LLAVFVEKVVVIGHGCPLHGCRALVRAVGVEPTRRCHRGILSVAPVTKRIDFVAIFQEKNEMC